MQIFRFLPLVLICASCVPFFMKSVRNEMVFEKVASSESNPSIDSLRYELGKALFYDPILSSDSSVSCASCHKQKFAFADNKKISPGVSGRLAKRNAPTLANVGELKHFLFDASVPTLEMQILVPIQEHAEMDDNIVDVAERLKKISYYRKLSQAAYNQDPSPFVITRSIAHFERQLTSRNSRFDQYMRGETKLSKSEKNGMKLFFHELQCSRCHSGPNFSNQEPMNNGISANENDPGRMRLTDKQEDFGLFKVPTLRNIALTAPYMHDGRFSSLESVVNHYQKGGDATPNKSELIEPFSLSKTQANDLINFLNTLTDSLFLTDKKIGPPIAR